MTQNPTDVPLDLELLRARHAADGWFFTSAWVAAGSGPDRRMLIGQRHGVVLADFTTEALTAKIDREGAR